MKASVLLAVLQADGPYGRPAHYLGFEPGADSMLADWKQVSGYMNGLAQHTSTFSPSRRTRRKRTSAKRSRKAAASSRASPRR